VIEYRSMAGAAYHSALWQMLRHVVNHSTYHRGQVTTMLRQLGRAAPSTDLIHYYRTMEPELAAN
ncbi:MAG: DinB family protein, partial [Longimicrobiales bacterium]